EIKVDEVLNADAECVYQITRMVRDRDRKVIEHPKAMKLTFDKLGQRTGANTDPISADLYEHTHEDALRGLEDKIRVGYQFNLTTTPGARVRAAVRNTLTEIHATKLRGASGGAYFVKRDRYPVVEALER